MGMGMGMAMASKWIRSFFTSGKKSKEKEKGENDISQPTSIPTENPATPIIIPPANLKEKRRWSFRRSSATKDLNSAATVSTNGSTVHIGGAQMESGNEQNHNMATAVTVIHQTNAAVAPPRVEEVAAIKIQAAFRCHLARRALCALKGIVKLQALVRGQLMRRRATAILQCMEALATVQKRAQAQRLRGAREAQPINQRQSIHRKSSKEIRFTQQACGETGTDRDENIKMVEVDLGEPRESSKSRHSYSTHPQERMDPRYSEYYPRNCANLNQDHLHVTPVSSGWTGMSSRASSEHFEDDPFSNAQGSQQYYSDVSMLDPTRTPLVVFPRNDGAASISTDYQFNPRYMGNTKSSRAKARSHSAPKQRSESYRSTMEGNSSPRMRMQRSSSHIGSYRYPSSIKLDISSVSLQDSECGSTSTVLTNTSYCRSHAA